MSIDDYCWTADTLFSTINSTPFPFPDPREIGAFQSFITNIYFSPYFCVFHIELIFVCFVLRNLELVTYFFDEYIKILIPFCFRSTARAGIADFIQPSLGPLQPNLDDFMNELPLQGNLLVFQSNFRIFIISVS